MTSPSPSGLRLMHSKDASFGVYLQYSRLLPVVGLLMLVSGLLNSAFSPMHENQTAFSRSRAVKVHDLITMNRLKHLMLGLLMSAIGDVSVSVNSKLAGLCGTLFYVLSLCCYVFALNETPGIRMNFNVLILFLAIGGVGFLSLYRHITKGALTFRSCSF